MLEVIKMNSNTVTRVMAIIITGQYQIIINKLNNEYYSFPHEAVRTGETPEGAISRIYKQYINESIMLADKQSYDYHDNHNNTITRVYILKTKLATCINDALNKITFISILNLSTSLEKGGMYLLNDDSYTLTSAVFPQLINIFPV